MKTDYSMYDCYYRDGAWEVELCWKKQLDIHMAAFVCMDREAFEVESVSR